MQETQFLIEPTQAEAMLAEDNLLIIDLGNAETYQQHHIQGAINLNYEHLVHGQLPIPGGLPATHRLQALFDALGLTPETKVLVYDDEGGGKACRFIWTLDMIGHQHYRLINGGIHAWVNEGHPTTQSLPQPKPGQATISMSYDGFADKAYVLSCLGKDSHQILDTRTPQEYAGERGGMRKGHIPGAINFNWLDAIDRNRNLRFYADDDLHTAFEQLGLSKDKEIITYCYTMHRAAHTYAVLKHLGYGRVKGYAGSWAEWNSDPAMPIT